jgi:hypothetical protein
MERAADSLEHSSQVKRGKIAVMIICFYSTWPALRCAQFQTFVLTKAFSFVPKPCRGQFPTGVLMKASLLALYHP